MAYSVTEDYYRIRWAGSAALHGDSCLYTRARFEKPAEEVEELVLLSLRDGSETVLGEGFSPIFSPDGGKVLFSRKADGFPQLFLLDMETRQARQLTHMRFGAESARFSPDGGRICFTSRVELDSDPALWAKTPTAEEKQAEALRKIRHPYVTFSDYGYKSDEDGDFSVGRAWTLWSMALADETPALLSDGDRDHVMPAFTPDGKNILFVSNRNRPREESIGMDLFSVPAAGGEIKQLTNDCWIAYYPAPFQPVCTPDGEWVVFGALEPSLSGGMPLTRLYKLSLTAPDAKQVPLWPADAPCHEATCFLYNCENPAAGERPTAAVSADGNCLYFISGWQGAANLYRASLDHPEIQPVSAEMAAYRAVVRDGDRYLLSKGDFTHTPELYLADEAMMRGETAFAPRRLTNSNPWFAGMLSEPRELWMDTLDGESRVQGFVFPPQGMEEGKKYPAVVYIHGGPTPFIGAALTYEHQCILGAGMGLIVMNFRGSSGYGEAHQSMTRAYDGGAMTDILQFTDLAVRECPWMDGERLGVTGGSFGGYMVNWICGHTKRFKAAVTQRSIANELIQYASSDMAGSSKDYADFSDFMMEQLKKSPVSYAEKIDIPFLILHGMNDMRCPVEHAHQLFSAVRETHPDLPVKMILFPGMTHSFPMGGPIDLRIAHYDAMIGWFKKYL